MRRFALVLALLFLGACQYLNPLFYQGPFRDRDYREALEKWTAEGRVHDRMATVISLQATLRTPEFTSNYVEAYAGSYRLTEREKRELKERLMADARKYYDFILAAFTEDEKENNLHDPRSSFKLYLITPEGLRLKPLEVRRIRRVTEEIRGFYPYINPWREAYVVRFFGPPREGASLLVTCPKGTAELKYPSGS